MRRSMSGGDNRDVVAACQPGDGVADLEHQARSQISQQGGADAKTLMQR